MAVPNITDTGSNVGSNLHNAGATVPVFLCPSDPQGGERCDVSSYVQNSPAPAGGEAKDDAGRTNMVGIADSNQWWCSTNGYGWGRTDGNGILVNITRVKMDAVTDGLSNTMMVGEATGGQRGSNQAIPWAIVNLSDTGHGINAGGSLPGGKTDWAREPEGLINNGLASYHVGGCHALLGDGSVRFLSQNMSNDTLKALGGRKDGLVATEF